MEWMMGGWIAGRIQTREQQPKLPSQVFWDPVEDEFSGSGGPVHANTPAEL